MTMTKTQARELADLLDDGLSAEGPRQRLLCVVEVLRGLTDADHALSNADIRAVLAAKFGPSCAPAENTINTDIRAIRESGCLGLDVHTGPTGTWCESSQLSPANVRLMLNAVQASRFLTQEQSALLQESLFGLVSRYQEEDLAGDVHVDQRVRKNYQEAFANCDTVARALREGRKIEFRYAYNDFQGKPVALPGDDGSTLRVETPIALLFSDGNYYVESYGDPAWRHGINLMRSRVDRMYDVRVSSQKADRCRAVYNAKRSVAKRVREGFEMLGGDSRALFLSVRSDRTNEMFDRFGFGLKFAQFDGPVGDVTTRGITFVRVAQSVTFYRWLSGMQGGVRLVRPSTEVEMRTGPWRDRLKDVPYDQLITDYEAVAQGYREYLERAQTAL